MSVEAFPSRLSAAEQAEPFPVADPMIFVHDGQVGLCEFSEGNYGCLKSCFDGDKSSLDGFDEYGQLLPFAFQVDGEQGKYRLVEITDVKAYRADYGVILFDLDSPPDGIHPPDLTALTSGADVIKRAIAHVAQKSAD